MHPKMIDIMQINQFRSAIKNNNIEIVKNIYHHFPKDFKFTTDKNVYSVVGYALKHINISSQCFIYLVRKGFLINNIFFKDLCGGNAYIFDICDEYPEHEDDIIDILCKYEYQWNCLGDYYLPITYALIVQDSCINNTLNKFKKIVKRYNVYYTYELHWCNEFQYEYPAKVSYESLIDKYISEDHKKAWLDVLSNVQMQHENDQLKNISLAVVLSVSDNNISEEQPHSSIMRQLMLNDKAIAMHRMWAPSCENKMIEI